MVFPFSMVLPYKTEAAVKYDALGSEYNPIIIHYIFPSVKASEIGFRLFPFFIRLFCFFLGFSKNWLLIHTEFVIAEYNLFT